MNALDPMKHPAECELLRICANYQGDPAKDAIIRTLVPHVDWSFVTQAALRHRLIPLLNRNVSRSCSEMSEHIPGRLAQINFVNAAHNLRLSHELLRLLGLLELAGLPAVPFKGPVLADLLFGNISMRQFGDLDILVKQEDVRKAKQLLLADGYQPEFVLNGKIESEYLRSEHAFQFQKPESGFVVELHWRFGSRNQVFPVDPEGVWTRLERRRFLGRDTLTLGREDLLLYLCAHGAKHGWDRLEWVTCVSELVRVSEELDWDAVMRRAIASGAQRALHVGLLLGSDLAPMALPEAISTAMQSDNAAETLAAQARKRFFVEPPDHTQWEVYRHTFYLRTRERWYDRARILFYFSARVPHPLAKDWRLFKVPASLSFLYYLLRPDAPDARIRLSQIAGAYSALIPRFEGFYDTPRSNTFEFQNRFTQTDSGLRPGR